MHLTVEPSKPRLCNDNRILNPWMVDKLFNLDRLSDLPLYVGPVSFQTVCDDKSGYDHIMLSPDSRTFFGFECGGGYFTSNSIPFGWKLSAFIYHYTGLFVSHYFRSIGIPCSLYIDDRHTSHLRVARDSGIYRLGIDKRQFNLACTYMAAFLVSYTLVNLGYFISLQKSTLIRSQSVPYLGFLCDSRLQAFRLIPAKKEKLISLVESTLANDQVSLQTLQKLSGKCISLSLAVPEARLFTNDTDMAISKTSGSSRPLSLSGALRSKIEHWLFFLKDWSGFLAWRSEQHHQVKLFTDASTFAWAGVLNPDEIPVVAADYWPDNSFSCDVAVKEALVLANSLSAFKDCFANVRIDVFVDSTALVNGINRALDPTLSPMRLRLYFRSFYLPTRL